MKRDLRGTNMAIFILFFGAAFFEALHSKNVAAIIFWLFIALVFVALSLKKA